jgi:hypothetical protein
MLTDETKNFFWICIDSEALLFSPSFAPLDPEDELEGIERGGCC